MLTADQLDTLTGPITDLYEQYNQSVINDISRRLVKMGKMTDTAAWQMQRLAESGKVYENALAELAKTTGKSETELRKMFEDAGVKSMRFDDSIYKAAGLNPLPLNLSPAMAQVLAAGLRKTNGLVKNLTMTTAINAQHSFIQAADLAYMQVAGGAMSYDQAIRAGIKDVAAKGLSTINYASGHKDQLDVAMRRTVLTGVSQTTGNLQIARADDMGVDLVQTSAHIGARPEHQLWQGKIFSRSGASKQYPVFVLSTGYGTGAGLMGWNCRHSFYPFFEGISENAYKQSELDSYADKTVTYNGQEIPIYDATQMQRGIERKIRLWKRQSGALDAAGMDSTAETAKVKEWQSRMRDFIKQTGLQRQGMRESVIGATADKAKTANKISTPKITKLDFSSSDTHSLGDSRDLRSFYSDAEPVKPYLRGADTVISSFCKQHILKDHPERIRWIESHPKEIALAIQNPDIVELSPWKRNNGHWSQTFIREIPEDNGFTVVAISLANLPGEFEADFHQVTSIYFSDKRADFFKKSGELKQRWLELK